MGSANSGIQSSPPEIGTGLNNVPEPPHRADVYLDWQAAYHHRINKLSLAIIIAAALYLNYVIVSPWSAQNRSNRLGLAAHDAALLRDRFDILRQQYVRAARAATGNASSALNQVSLFTDIIIPVLRKRPELNRQIVK